MIRKIAIGAASVLVLSTGFALANEGGHTEDIAFSFEGLFGTFDEHQLQRGLQVYTEVCSACHGLKFVPIRTLSDEGGPHLPEDQVRAYAKEFPVLDEDSNRAALYDIEKGEMRTLLPSDKFPANNGAHAPDLSLMAKARAGFSGPYGLGTNQLFKGMGGAEHIYSVLSGYEENPACAPDGIDGFYYNKAFSAGGVPDSCKVDGVSTVEGTWIAMPPPLEDDLIAYQDETQASLHQMSEDVSAFLMWTAEPKLMARKDAGFKAVVLLILLSTLLYLTNKRLWAGVKGKKHTA